MVGASLKWWRPLKCEASPSVARPLKWWRPHRRWRGRQNVVEASLKCEASEVVEASPSVARPLKCEASPSVARPPECGGGLTEVVEASEVVEAARM